MEVQALIERRHKLQDDIRDAVVSLVKEFEFETGVDINLLSINDSDIDVIHMPAVYSELASVMGDDQPHKELGLIVRVGLDV